MKSLVSKLVVGSTLCGVLSFVVVLLGQNNVQKSLEEIGSYNLRSPREFTEYKARIFDLAEKGEGCEKILDAVSLIESESQRESILKYIIDEIADNDPKALLFWMRQNRERLSKYCDEDIIEPMCKHIPLEMLALAKEVCPLKPLPKLREEVEDRTYKGIYDGQVNLCSLESNIVEHAFGPLAADDVEMALEQLEHWRSQEFYYKSGLLRIMAAWSSQDTVAARNFIEENIEDNRFRENLITVHILNSKTSESTEIEPESRVISSAVMVRRCQESKDYKESAAWLDDQPESPGRDAAARVLVDTWLEHDQNAALDWVQTFKKGPLKDGCLRQIISICERNCKSKEQYAELMELAKSASDPKRLENTVSHLLTKLYLLDQKAAREAMNSNSLLSERGRARLERIFEGIDDSPKAEKLRDQLRQ